MRRRNMRLIIVGLVLVVAAGGFFLVMMGMAPKSNDPVSMMRTVGELSGAVAGIGLVMAIVGLVGRKS
jgi:cytochrome c-type biogenesis protein CcmE